MGDLGAWKMMSEAEGGSIYEEWRLGMVKK